MNLFEIPKDIWVECIIINNAFSGQDIIKLALSCHFFALLLKQDGRLKRYAESRKHVGQYQTLSGEYDLEFIQWSPDSRYIVVSDYSHQMAYVWCSRTGRFKQQLQISDDPIHFILVFHPREPHLLASYNSKAIQLFDITTGSEKQKHSILDDVSSSRERIDLAFHPLGKIALFCECAGIRRWDVEHGLINWDKKPLFANKQDEHFTSVTFTPDGQRVVATCLWHGVSIWNYEKEEQEKFVPFSGVYFVAITADSKLLAFGGPVSSDIKLLNLDDWSERTLPQQQRYYFVATFHPDKKHLVLTGRYMAVINIETMQLWRDNPSRSRFSPSPDGLAYAFVKKPNLFVEDSEKYLI